MKNKETYPKNIFVSLKDLLDLEHVARGFSFNAKKQKVKSILGGKHASKLRGRGLDFEEVRNYVPGDDIRNIDWKVTARTKKTHTRVYSEEKEKPALILVDQSKSMFFGSQLKTKSVVAAEFAAIAAFKISKEGDRVGGVVMGDEGIDILKPKRSKKNIFRFFDKLVERNRALGTSKKLNFENSFKEVMQKVNNIVSHDYLIILISDYFRYSDQVIKSISRLGQHNDVIVVKVYDPMERSIPNTKLVASQEGQQIVIDGSNKELSNKFEEGFDEDYNAFEKTLQKHRIPLIKVDTVRPIEEQIKEIFKKTR
ncbi:MAG: hypothetical protein BM564_08865 [Bacteroidetes bacterium MedPE-SWsnd-G2]|nr:MAG: hypothetical protein BM564_08865 [Bacteroidetes bacterium MedPE-SWsnd-G2]